MSEEYVTKNELNLVKGDVLVLQDTKADSSELDNYYTKSDIDTIISDLEDYL